MGMKILGGKGSLSTNPLCVDRPEDVNLLLGSIVNDMKLSELVEMQRRIENGDFRYDGHTSDCIRIVCSRIHSTWFDVEDVKMLVKCRLKKLGYKPDVVEEGVPDGYNSGEEYVEWQVKYAEVLAEESPDIIAGWTQQDVATVFADFTEDSQYMDEYSRSALEA